MIVVDASIAVNALLDNGHARLLIRTEALAAPGLIDYEVASSLRGKVRGGHLDATRGRLLIETWRHTAVERHAADRLLDRIWELRDSVSVYDAAYVVVAEALGCRLLTGDRRLAAAPGVRCEVVLVSG